MVINTSDWFFVMSTMDVERERSGIRNGISYNYRNLGIISSASYLRHYSVIDLLSEAGLERP